MRQFYLTEADLRALREMKARHKSDPHGHGGLLLGIQGIPRTPPHLIAVVYGGALGAATIDGNGKITAAGTGEAKPYKLFDDGSGVADPVELPISILSVMPQIIPEGAAVILLWCPFTCDPADEDVPTGRYVAIRVVDANRRSGFGILSASGSTSPTDTGLVKITTISVELVNNDDLDPVVSAQVSDIGPPVRYDRLIANDAGNYRYTLHANLRFGISPSEPTAPFSYQNKIATVTAGQTNDLCGHTMFRKEQFWLFKNANFTTPTVADGIALAHVWARYECGDSYWGDLHFSRPIELEAGDTLSLWVDADAKLGSYVLDYNVECSLHYESREIELS